MKDRILAFLEPNRSIPLYITGTAAFTLVLQAIYDFANEPGKFKGGYWLALIAFVIAGVVFAISLAVKPKPIYIDVDEKKRPKKYMGLVVLVGNQLGSAPAAIDYHIPELRYLWLVGSPESHETIRELTSQYKGRIAQIFSDPEYIASPFDISPTYQVVDRILTKEIRKLKLKPDEVILDITGATKPMTSGMFLAGFANRAAIQYMQVLRDKDGNVKPGSIPAPTRIDTSFNLKNFNAD